MRIVVLGATGSLGRALVAKAAGHDVVAVSRHGAVRADVATGEGLAEALAGADVVMDATNGPDTVLVAGTRRVLEAAAASGVRHFVGISIVGIDGAPIGYYRIKRDQERVIEQSPVPWTLLRATQFHSLIPRFATGKFGVALAPRGWRLQPVDVREVAGVLIEAAVGAPAGRIPDVGGPEIVPFVDLARAWHRAAGERRLVLHVPVPGAKGRWLRSDALCTPERKVGTITFAQWLTETYPTRIA